MLQFLQSLKETLVKNRKQAVIIAAAGALLIVILVTAAVSLAGHDPLKGRWSLDGVTVYEFRGGGSGALVLDTGEYPFRYRTDGDRLTIDFVSEAAADRDYTYSVKGKTLTLTAGEQRYEMSKE